MSSRLTADRLNNAGVFGVGLAAAVLSFASLKGLAELVGYSRELSWLLPLCVDLYGLVATRVWLGSNGQSNRVRRWARGSAWLAIAISITGNGTFHRLRAAHVTPDWRVIVAVSALPPIMLGLAVHLRTLITATQPAAASPVEPAPEPPVTGPPPEVPAPVVSAAVPSSGMPSKPVVLPSTPMRPEVVDAPAPVLPPGDDSPADEVADAPAPPPVPATDGTRPRRLSKRAQLAALYEAEVSSDDERTVYELAKILAPRVGLHEGTARRYLAELTSAREADAKTSPRLHAVEGGADS